MNTRQKLISALRASQGEWISGEALREQLGVSRAAVSKQIKALKQAGYRIQSAPRRGYLFEGATLRLLPDEIREALKQRKTTLFGQAPMDYSESLDSTNTRAKELAAQGAPQGTLVLAENQSGGRGRKGRLWFSKPGEGIFLSLVLRPGVSPMETSRFTLLTAVALARALTETTAVQITIKWPNDLLAGTGQKARKLAGILTEVSMEMDSVDHMVVGVGINIGHTAFPPELSKVATSVFLETGETPGRAEIVAAFLSHFEQLMARMENEGFAPIMEEWKAHTRFLGRRVAVAQLNQTISGRATDIDSQGFLMVRDDGGNEHRIFSGDVTLLP